ncbi:MAG: hypothetical protein JOZ44_07425, partial [Acidobacteria bacterium]|nr:hypothetical protein [Acidobacteriota bacterium]
LDDIDPLRWPSDFAGSSAPVLLEPEHTIRARWDMNQDTPLPVETPAGKNPPDGALIDYFLPDAAQSVKLEIYDAAGKLVRSIGTQPEPFDTAPANAPEYWFEQAKALSNHAGLNRYVWDLRYPAPRTLRYSYYNNPTEYIEYTLADHAIPGETPRQQPMGVLVLPGKYTLALTVDGKSYRRTLQVEADPRVHVPATDLAEQLRVERIASGAMDASYEAFQQSKKLLDAVNGETVKTEGKESDKTTPPALSALQKKVEEVANHDHNDLGFGPANRELARLFEMISSGDGRPAAPLAEGITQICRDVSKRLDEWKTINGKDVPEWNSSSTPKLPTAETIPTSPACQ